ncbi:hypothetical protein TNCV_1197911 [Trichonephila clavipes]|uniref:Secreted protein n=1 Tax=Trichonephila clavipes TaxID=2585209 RepID=A0A8X6VDK9_TRICX|nr:hypothetical protein TNCV_1197911 [Trichonephila clavipes]
MPGWNCTKAWWLNHGLMCILWHSLGSLLRVPTSLKAIQCVELLGDHLHPLMLRGATAYGGPRPTVPITVFVTLGNEGQEQMSSRVVKLMVIVPKQS